MSRSTKIDKYALRHIVCSGCPWCDGERRRKLIEQYVDEQLTDLDNSVEQLAAERRLKDAEFDHRLEQDALDEYSDYLLGRDEVV